MKTSCRWQERAQQGAARKLHYALSFANNKEKAEQRRPEKRRARKRRKSRRRWRATRGKRMQKETEGRKREAMTSLISRRGDCILNSFRFLKKKRQNSEGRAKKRTHLFHLCTQLEFASLSLDVTCSWNKTVPMISNSSNQPMWPLLAVCSVPFHFFFGFLPKYGSISSTASWANETERRRRDTTVFRKFENCSKPVYFLIRFLSLCFPLFFWFSLSLNAEKDPNG